MGSSYSTEEILSYFLTPEKLKKLNTKRLLAYKKSLLKNQTHLNNEQHTEPSDLEKMWEKMWNETYANVKAELATREHVEKKGS